MGEKEDNTLYPNRQEQVTQVGAEEMHQCASYNHGYRCTIMVPVSSNFCNYHTTPKAIVIPPDTIEHGHRPALYFNPSWAWDGHTEVDFRTFMDESADEILDYHYANSLVHIQRYRGKHMLNDVHFRLQVNGTRNDIDLFYAVLHEVDHDFPLDPFRNHTAQIGKCSTCKGYVWEKAVITPDKIKLAAKQIGVRVKVKLWLEGGKCKGHVDKVVVA